MVKLIIKNNIEDTKDLIIFDIDGTLLYYDTLDDLIKEALISFEFEPLDEYVKRQNLGVVKSLLSSTNNNDFSYQQLFDCWNESLVFLQGTNITAQMIGQKMIDLEPKYTRIMPEVKETLNLLDGRLICSTNWFKKSQILKLNKTGLGSYFSEIYTCEEINAKPSRKHFEYILTKEKILPSKTVMIGDSSSDLSCSQLGIDSILIDFDNSKQRLYDQATCVVTNFSDIEKVLKKVN